MAMDRSPQHVQGYRQAAKEAVTFLHEQARRMNDKGARAALNLTADELGRTLADRAKRKDPTNEHG